MRPVELKYDGKRLPFMNQVQGKEFKVIVFVKPGAFKIIKPQAG